MFVAFYVAMSCLSFISSFYHLSTCLSIRICQLCIQYHYFAYLTRRQLHAPPVLFDVDLCPDLPSPAPSRWEEEKVNDGVKWRTLEHKGVLLAPPYEPLPSHVRFYYDGKEMRLSEEAEEIATFYSKMLDHDYTTKEVFNKNFFHDWRKAMTEKEREKITHLKKCDFTKMAAWFKVGGRSLLSALMWTTIIMIAEIRLFHISFNS